MIKKMMLVLCLLLLLSACGHAPETSEPESGAQAGTQTNVQTRAPEDHLQSSTGDGFVETPEGYMHAASSRSVGRWMLCFCPKGESAFYVLCGKPNCRHDDFDCNACTDHDFTVFNGAIYAIDTVNYENGISVIKMNLDGTDHQTVAKLNIDESRSITYNYHRGKLYVVSLPDDSVPLEQRDYHLYALDLTDGTQKELEIAYFQTGEWTTLANIYQDKYYFYGYPKDSTYDLNDQQLVEVDLNTGDSRVLMQGNVGCSYVTDSTIYYLESGSRFLSAVYGEAVEAESERSRFAEYDRSTGTVRHIDSPLQEVIWGAFYDEDFIYASEWVESGNGFNSDLSDGEISFYFLSRDYQLVDQITLESGVRFNCAASDRVFFSDDSGPMTYYLDKSEIGSHQLTLHPLEVIGFPQGEAS